MTELSVHVSKADVTLNVTDSNVVIEEKPINIHINDQSNSVVVSKNINSLVLEIPESPGIEVLSPDSVTVEIRNAEASLASFLNAARTDAGNTSFTYVNGQLTASSRDGLSKSFTYNNDGTLNTATTVTTTKTITKTFSYTNGALTSITVS